MKEEKGDSEKEDDMNYNASHAQYNYAQEYNITCLNDFKNRYPKDKSYLSDNTLNGVMLNPKQLYWIFKRKARRELLDSLMISQKNNYMHESRHRHAMKRMRAPSGRFLTKEEMNELSKSNDEIDKPNHI